MVTGRWVRFPAEGLWIRASVYGCREMGVIPGGRTPEMVRYGSQKADDGEIRPRYRQKYEVTARYGRAVAAAKKCPKLPYFRAFFHALLP